MVTKTVTVARLLVTPLTRSATSVTPCAAGEGLHVDTTAYVF